MLLTSENYHTEALVTSKEDKRAFEIAKKSCVAIDEHYEISLPRRGNVKLPSNYPFAEQRLRKLGNSLRKDPEAHEKYREKICKFIADSHAVENKSEHRDDSSVEYFVPYHCTRPPAKFHIVFDCAAFHAGSLLKDGLLQGPDSVHSLSGVLHHFHHYNNFEKSCFRVRL